MHQVGAFARRAAQPDPRQEKRVLPADLKSIARSIGDDEQWPLGREIVRLAAGRSPSAAPRSVATSELVERVRRPGGGRTCSGTILEALAKCGRLSAFEIEGERVNCHDIYVAREHHFGKDVLSTRKGAVRARAGDHTLTHAALLRSFIGTEIEVTQADGAAWRIEVPARR